jgi:DNA-binding transcriptional LysR family regulator
MLDVRRLRLLCDLARLGTIAAVAAAHRYTASAVSQQLSALEREAGVRLLARTGRSVTLTAAGRMLVRHGTAVLAELEQATASLAAMAGGLTGPLRIGAFPTAVRALFPAALVALGRAHPGLELMVTELDPADVPAALCDRRVDVGLINDYDLVPALPDPGLGDVPLLDEPVYLAVPATWSTDPTGTTPAASAPAASAPAASAPTASTPTASTPTASTPTASTPTGTGRPDPARARVAVNVDNVDPVNMSGYRGTQPANDTSAGAGAALRGLHDAPWILATPGTVCHTVTVQLCRAAGFSPRGRHHADDFTTVLSLVAAGLGVSVVPAMAVENGRADGVRLEALPTRRRSRIAYRKGAAGHPAVAAFVAAIRESCEFAPFVRSA